MSSNGPVNFSATHFPGYTSHEVKKYKFIYFKKKKNAFTKFSRFDL